MFSVETGVFWVFVLCLGACLKILGYLSVLSTVKVGVYVLDNVVVLVFKLMILWCFGV